MKQQASSRIRSALAAIAVVTAVATPVVVAATPAQAGVSNRPCPTFYCGSGNHNEEAAEDV